MNITIYNKGNIFLPFIREDLETELVKLSQWQKKTANSHFIFTREADFIIVSAVISLGNGKGVLVVHCKHKNIDDVICCVIEKIRRRLNKI